MSTYSMLRGMILAAACAVLVLFSPHDAQAGPATVLLSGSVADSGGNAVPGAELFFRPAGYWPGIEKWTSPPTQTDAEGRFQIALPRTAENGQRVYPGTLWAFKPGKQLAWQKVSDAIEASSPLKLTLAPPSGLRIKVLAPDKKPLAGAQVALSQFATGEKHEQEYLPLAIQSRMAAVCNSDGIATITALAPQGAIGIQVTSADFGTQAFYTPSKPTEDLTVNLAAMGRVRGRVVADKPEAARNIPVRIATQLRRTGLPGFASAKAVSDDQGRFEVSIAEGELEVGISPALKPSYLVPGDRPEKQVLNAGETAEVEVRIVPAVRVHGVVREKDTGKRVPAIGVNYPRSAGTIDWAEPDASGRFEFYQTSGMAHYYIRCSEPDKTATWLCNHFAAFPPNVKEFELLPVELCYVHLRVVDEAGKPVPGATIKNVWYKPTAEEQAAVQGLTGTTGSAKPVSADADGRFAVWVEAGTKYCLSIVAEGMPAAETQWIDLGNLAAIPDIVLLRPTLRAIAGRVVDRQGSPVAGVIVFQSRSGPRPTETITGADGKFRLEGIEEPKAFVFARKAGFRFCGRIVAGSPGDLELVLARADEPGARTLHALPLPLNRAERLAMAKRILEPVVKDAMAPDARDDARDRALSVLARIEPARALRLIEQKPFKDPELQDMIRGAAAVALFPESPGEARAVVETMADPYFRCMTYVIYFWDAVPATERPRKLELLTAALLYMQGITEPWQRVVMRGQIARRLIELGQRERATKLLREGETAAKALATSDMEGYVRGTLADELAAIDLPAALELIKDLSDQGEYFRHHGNIAHKIAGANPAEAQRILERLRTREANNNETTSSKTDQYAPRVCYRMAPVDLDRAKQIASGVSDVYQKAHAHAVMAQAVAKTQPVAARELLDRAFGAIEELKDRRHANDVMQDPYVMQDPARVAPSLLPIAELIDPELVDEFLWRAVSLRRQLAENEQPSPLNRPRSDRIDPSDVRLALVLARYDRAVAEALFAPHGKRLPTEASWRDETDAILYAAAILDPRQAAAMVEGLPDGEVKSEARHRLAKFLTRDENKCWNFVQRRILMMWVIDEEDIDEATD